MKKLILLLPLITFLAGCTSNEVLEKYDDIYSDRHQCNGDIEVSHTMVIVDTDNPQVKGPEVKATCTPKVYDPRTDFEKENRRGNF